MPAVPDNGPYPWEKPAPGILRWDKPPKIMTTEQWRAISADSAPPGVYVPNMSAADAGSWKAKLFRGADPPRVEIRKTACGTQVLIAVNRGGMRVSMNGPAVFTMAEWGQLSAAVAEAVTVLEEAAR
jgi:hypothetical protein